MKIRKESKFTRIREAITKDGINYIIGLSGIPFPLEVIKEVIKIIEEEATPHFVDWKLENWPQIYHQELKKCVKLPYKGKEHFLPQVLIFDNIEKNLNLSNIHFSLMQTHFSLRNEVRALTESSFEKLLNYLRRKRIFINEHKLRLVNIIEECEKVTLIVQSVEYKYYVHTNLVLDAKPKGRDQTLREALHSSGKLEDLDKSSLADLLGINILLFTADGSLIMQKRSKKVAFRTGELCPSASGTLSLTDVPNVPNTITLKDMPKLREAFEEIGLITMDVPIDQIFFLGITRELIRGGTADMFFFAQTNLSEKDVIEKRKDARDRWESKKLIFFNFGSLARDDLNSQTKKHGFLSKVDDFIDKYIDQSSIPLLTSVALWVKYRMEGNSDRKSNVA